MAAISDNKYDVYNWVHSVIGSMDSIRYYPACRKLIRSFHIKYQDWELKDKLDVGMEYKLDELGAKKKEVKQLLKG